MARSFRAALGRPLRWSGPFSWTSVLSGLKQRAEFAEKRASIEMHHAVRTSFISFQQRSSTSDPSTLQEKQERPQRRKDETHALRCGTERRSRIGAYLHNARLGSISNS